MFKSSDGGEPGGLARRHCLNLSVNPSPSVATIRSGKLDGSGTGDAVATRCCCAKALGVPSRNEPLIFPTVVPRSAMVNTLEPPLRREFTSPRNCRTVRSLKDDLGLKFVRMRSPKRIPEAPGRSPASEKSTLNSSPRTSPPNPPDAVEIGLTTLELSGANGPTEGM